MRQSNVSLRPARDSDDWYIAFVEKLEAGVGSRGRVVDVIASSKVEAMAMAEEVKGADEAVLSVIRKGTYAQFCSEQEEALSSPFEGGFGGVVSHCPTCGTEVQSPSGSGPRL